MGDYEIACRTRLDGIPKKPNEKFKKHWKTFMYLAIQNIPCHLIKYTAGQSLGKNVRLHSLPLAVLDVDLAVLDPVGDK